MFGAKVLFAPEVERPGVLGEEGVDVELGRGQGLDEGGDLLHAPPLPSYIQKYRVGVFE